MFSITQTYVDLFGLDCADHSGPAGQLSWSQPLLSSFPHTPIKIYQSPQSDQCKLLGNVADPSSGPQDNLVKANYLFMISIFFSSLEYPVTEGTIGGSFQ
jgi:hypothetical protein